MKQFIFMMLIIAGMTQSVNAQGWYGSSNGSSRTASYSRFQPANASITISNRSDYTLTVKILKTGGRGLYRTVCISPKSSSSVYFSSSDTFFTKTKAVKNGFLGGETLYRKGDSFSVQCNSNGYTEGTLDFYVSAGNGSCGQGISKSELESNR